jgi:4-carboxymuconolactone decarboxylase
MARAAAWDDHIDEAWLAQAQEPVLDAEAPIIDPHRASSPGRLRRADYGTRQEESVTENDSRSAAAALFKSWRSKAIEGIGEDTSSDFCPEINEIAMDSVFAKLWLREGLDLRARSLLTLGMLIALHAHDELMVHFPIALKNGCTLKELEEVIYHSTAYAGFPAANIARRAAIRTLRDEKLIP